MKKVALLITTILIVGAVAFYTKASRPGKKAPADTAKTAVKGPQIEEISITEVEYVEDPVPEKPAK